MKTGGDWFSKKKAAFCERRPFFCFFVNIYALRTGRPFCGGFAFPGTQEFIGQKLDTVGEHEPGDRIAPDQCREVPGEGVHEDARDCEEGGDGLGAQYRE